jgi:hypothetical protein
MACYGNTSRRALTCPSWNADDIAAIAHTLNTRPRKTLGWRTPAEAFAPTIYTRFTKPVLRPPIESAQYSARAMAQACADAGLRRSMGATGICWDNSGTESLWSTFKHEYYYRHTSATKTDLVAAVDKWMHF